MRSWLRRDGRRREVRRVAPAVNVRDTEKEIILEAEMAGLRKEDIKVRLRHDELVISGVRDVCQPPKGYTVVYRERCPFEYSRKFILGDEVKKENINARYEDGILTLTLEKAQGARPRRIEVQ